MKIEVRADYNRRQALRAHLLKPATLKAIVTQAEICVDECFAGETFDEDEREWLVRDAIQCIVQRIANESLN